MITPRRPFICFLLASSLILHPSSLARADGGTVRLSAQKGSYRITVFTSPTVLRAGPVDISVLVQEAATGELAAGVEVNIKVVRPGSTRVAFHGPATTEAATNKLYYAANCDLPEPGWYAIEVSIDGVLGKAQVFFELQAAEALPSWPALLPWVGWPFAVIALFGIHQFLARQKRRSARMSRNDRFFQRRDWASSVGQAR
jgi:hypothetical protein